MPVSRSQPKHTELKACPSFRKGKESETVDSQEKNAKQDDNREGESWCILDLSRGSIEGPPTSRLEESQSLLERPAQYSVFRIGSLMIG